MEENNTLGLFKTLEVFDLKFDGVPQKTKMPRNIPFSSEEKTHEQKEIDTFLIMDIFIIQYLSYDLACGYILNIFT